MKKRNIFLSAALVLVGILAFCSAIDKAAELKEYQKTKDKDTIRQQILENYKE